MTREEQIIQESIKKYPRFPERRIGFIDGAQWEHKKLVEMACEWLSNNKDNYIIDIEGETLFDDQIIKDFRNAMEK